ncbi:MAG: ASPIC/UnbV domain-containing protein, partial [Flavobacteriaceae bacterium]|nr:ASPIC/UnbV domain-containing protein [Flavobacteriaceae bacterium]
MSHFGIGTETTIDQLIVRWPSGNVDLINNPSINQVITINEGDFPCTSSTTWDGTDWSNSIPDMFTTAVFEEDYTTSDVGSGSIDVCTCEVVLNKTLTIAAGDFLKTNKDIIVNGNLIVEHEGSVVQINDDALVSNNGSIIVRKLTPILSGTDFMILGNPMSAETREGVYGNGRRVLNHITGNFVPNGAVGAGTENFVDDNNNNWGIHTGTLTLAEGYLVKPQAIGNPPVGGQFTLDYTLGTLNNGLINYPLLFNTTREDSPNMLGNPYASAIDLDLFLSANSLIDAVYYWQHITPPSNAFPGFNQLNYNLGDISIYNQGSGGTAAPNGGGIPTQFMASGQGFGVKALGDGDAVFNNNMRVISPNTDYRSLDISDRQRIWLDVKNNSYGLISNMLVAFTEEATDGFEGNFDSRRFDTPVSLYSILDSDEELAIQGRSAFNEEQKVQLGFSTMVEEVQTYSISIRQIEGVDISNATVYLYDNDLNIVANLSIGEYSFSSNAIQNSERFVLLFQDRVLASNDVAFQNIQLLPNPTTG